MQGTVLRIVESSKRSGQSVKNGKTFDWNIMSVEVKMPDGSLVVADSFDTLVDGDTVTVETKTTEKDGRTFTNTNASLPKTNPYGDKTAAQNNAEIMQAIRLTYQAVKTLTAKVDQLLGNNADLAPTAPTPPVAPPPPPIPPEPTVEPVSQEPVNPQTGKPWDKWAQGDTPASRAPDTVIEGFDADEPINLDDIPF